MKSFFIIIYFSLRLLSKSKNLLPSTLTKNITYDRYSFYIKDSRCITVLLYTAIFIQFIDNYLTNLRDEQIIS